MKEKMTWKDVTLRQFLQLQEAAKIEDEEEQLFKIAEIILGKEVLNLPISEFTQVVKSGLEFMKEPIPEEKVPLKKLKVNGREYYTDCLLGNITTEQYLSFNNHSKSNDFVKMLSVFIVPKDHKFNDGYDMEEVFSDINDLPYIVVSSICSFFRRQFELYMRAIQCYSSQTLKMTNLPEKEKKLLQSLLENSVDLALFPISSNSVK